MSYIINKTNGSVLTEVEDGYIDQLSCDLTLIGKNTSNYGEYINENIVHLLENFSNTIQPINPINGQLWYDSNENLLKVFSNNVFKVVGSVLFSDAVPLNISAGEIWIDKINQQMYFNNGTDNILIGPGYAVNQGTSGLEVIDLIDNANEVHTVLLLKISNILLGIWSTVEFTPSTTITGFSGIIKIGFNPSMLVSQSTEGVSANFLVSPTGEYLTSNNFISSIENSATIGTISIQNNIPFILGSSGQWEVTLSNASFNINSNSINQNFQINLNNINGTKPCIMANSVSEYVGIYTASPTATLDVNGSMSVRGVLSVNNNKISNVNDPTDVSDAVNFSTLKSKSIALSADTTGLSDQQIADQILDIILPSNEYMENTVCRLHCIDNNVRTNKQYSLIGNTWTFDFNF